MYSFKGISQFAISLLLIAVMTLVIAQEQTQQQPQQQQPEEHNITIKEGRYIPELYGAHLGKYIPDDSGKYYHIHRPYDGGYGDTGIKYVHDLSGNLVPLSSRKLSPKDHLRFMIDFNYDNSGWQIINFEWLRDGDENYKFKYINENQLFTNNVDQASDDAQDVTVSDSNSSTNTEPGNGSGDGHLEGEYNDNNGYNYTYDNENDSATKASKNLQKALREVIYYIENNIIPTL